MNAFAHPSGAGVGLVELAGQRLEDSQRNAHGNVVVVLIIGPSARNARSFLNGPAHSSQMIAETQGRRLLALNI
jgi:hypothetical protein